MEEKNTENNTATMHRLNDTDYIDAYRLKRFLVVLFFLPIHQLNNRIDILCQREKIFKISQNFFNSHFYPQIFGSYICTCT